MRTQQILLRSGIALLFLGITLGFIAWPVNNFSHQKEIQQADNNLTIVIGGGGNSGVLVTDSAVLVIDTKMGDDAEALYNMAKEKAGKKSFIVINTHFHNDHTKGNHFYAGSRIYIGDMDKSVLLKEVGQENMPNIFVKDSLRLNLGDEVVMLYAMGQAHTFNDLIVYLKKRQVLFTGDLIFHDINPFLDREGGANVDKWISVLGKIQVKFHPNKVVPGHGKTGGPEMIDSMKQYFVDMQNAAKNPEKENELKEKYKDWRAIPNMTSPEKTIEYIRKK